MTTPKVKQKTRLPIEVLDRTRPFGEVYGETSHQIRYTQRTKGIEAWPYDAHDALIEAALNEAQKKRLAEMRAAAAKQAPAPAAADTVEEKEDVVDEIEPDGRAKDDDGVNLLLWLKGEVRHRPTEIQEVLKARFGVNKPATAQQALYLVEEQKILPRAQVHPSILPPAPV